MNKKSHNINSFQIALCSSAIAFLGTGCGSTGPVSSSKGIALSEDASLVQISDAAAPESCTFSGRVNGLEDRAARVMLEREHVLERDTNIALRNNGAALGANYVQIDPEDYKENSGLAYLCPQFPAPQQHARKLSELPPEEKPALPTSTAPFSGEKSVRQRLEEANALYADGLIDEDEFEETKARILQDL